MSYTPTEWKTGDVITAEKLNNMESGIVGGQELFIIHATGVATVPGTPTTPVLDKTYNEIVDAIQQGKIPFVVSDEGDAQTASKQVFSLVAYVGGGLNICMFGLTKLQANQLYYTSILVSANECGSEYSMFVLPTNSTQS